MKPIIGILAAILLLGCSDKQVTEEDNSKIKSIMDSNLRPGMQTAEVADVFAKYGTPLEIYNPCTEEYESPLTACEKGYSAVGIIKLGNRSFWLGEGQAQVYLTFNADKDLVNDFFYELYYEKQH